MRFMTEFDTLIHTCSVHYLTDKINFCSPYFELIGILDGSCICFTDTAPCQKGAIITVPPLSPISPVPVENCTLLRLSFSPELLLDILDTDMIFEKRSIFTGKTELFTNMANYADSFLLKCTDDSFQKTSLLFPILSCLSKLFPSKAVHHESVEKMTLKQTAFLDRILQYVQKHYRDEISLSDAASHFDVTPQYFANFFKKFMQQTFHQYLQSYRYQKGLAYLTYTSLMPETVCHKVGLNQPALLEDFAAAAGNSSYDGEPDANAVHNNLGTALLPSSAEKYLHEYTLTSKLSVESSVPPTVIEAEVTMQTPTQTPWLNLINLGYATDFSNIQIFNQLIRTQEEIGFAYGRICRLFDLITEYTVAKRTIYDYNRIFRLLDVMIEHHMLPFIELSNKLFRIQLNLLETVPINIMKDSSAYYDRLLELLPDFIRACINRYGQACFDKWKFEISYTNYDFVENAEDFPLMKYVRYFHKIKNIIRTFSLHCQIGGPGFNYWYSPQKLAEILSLFSANKTMPDFVTAYIYPLTSDDSQAALSTDEDLTFKRLSALRDVTYSQHDGMEIWITEFNSNLSSRNLLNDSSYQSAFLAKTLTAAAGLGIQAIGYYMLSDVPLRYVDTLDLLFGGWGLFSDRDIPKPSYYAYSLLAKLGTYLLKYESPFLLTCNSNYSFQCLFFNYEHIAPAFCKKNVTIQDFAMPDILFQSASPVSRQIRINSARPGTYLVKEYVISEKESNLLAQWEHTGYLNISKEDDIKALELRSQLIPHIYTIEVKAEEPLIFEIHPGHQEVRLLQIDLHVSANTHAKEVD